MAARRYPPPGSWGSTRIADVLILRAAAIPLTPWPNGLGVTRQLLDFPDSEHPFCQASLAEITTDAPFSHFPDIDRITVPVTGRGMTLDVAGFGQLVADGTHAALRYPGDLPTMCRLTDGPMRVLNVMTMRGKATAEQTLHRLATPLSLDPAGGAVLVWCLDGHATSAAGQALTADEGLYTRERLVLHGAATLIVVQMHAAE